MKDLAISEVARRAGIRPSAIRYYESIGLLPKPHRVSGQRRYDLRILQQLAFIQVAQQAGFSIVEIHTLFSRFEEDAPLGERWRTLAPQKLIEVEALISKAQEMKHVLEEGMRCVCPTIDECLPLSKWATS